MAEVDPARIFCGNGLAVRPLFAFAVKSTAALPTRVRDETDFAFRHLPERFHHQLFLACPYPGLQVVEGIVLEHRHDALTHDRAGVVFGVDQMNRHTRFLLAGRQHRLEHPIAVHPWSAESRQEGWVGVEDSALERAEYEWSELLHVAREE